MSKWLIINDEYLGGAKQDELAKEFPLDAAFIRHLIYNQARVFGGFDLMAKADPDNKNMQGFRDLAKTNLEQLQELLEIVETEIY